MTWEELRFEVEFDGDVPTWVASAIHDESGRYVESGAGETPSGAMTDCVDRVAAKMRKDALK
jgi:hypothetical protein